MKNVLWIGGLVVGLIVIVGGVLFFNNQANNKSATSSSISVSNKSTSSSSVVTTTGYEYFSDKSITKQPTANMTFGGGQRFEVTYDGSALTGGDETLSYYPSYFLDTGTPTPLGGGNMYAAGSGVFGTDSAIFTSDANVKKGFVEVIATSVIDGKGIDKTIGRYPVAFEVK